MIVAIAAGNVWGQSDSSDAPTPSVAANASNVPEKSIPAEALDEGFFRSQIADLSHSSYRTRQMALWRLQQHPHESIKAIRECIHVVDYNTGSQLVDLLSQLAAHGEVATSLLARQTLIDMANHVSSVGRLADNTLRAIADLKEEQAIAILLHHGAKLGSPQELQFALNSRLQLGSENLALQIDESFRGSDETIEWIQFLKSIDTVFLQGPGIDSRHYRALSSLRSIRNVKLKYVSISREELLQFKNFDELELLELNYMEVDDDMLSALAELPIRQSLKLFGTQISQAGATMLAQQLDGIEIFCGKGGYLGVGMDQNTMVTQVTPGSAAQRAGIQLYDELTHVNNVPITTFAELRVELGKHMAGEKIQIRLTRVPGRGVPGGIPGGPPGRRLVEEAIELDLTVELGEDPK
jgi:hypothetical protein